MDRRVTIVEPKATWATEFEAIAAAIQGLKSELSRYRGEISTLDARLRQGQWESQWAVDTAAPPLWPELAAKSSMLYWDQVAGPGRRAVWPAR